MAGPFRLPMLAALALLFAAPAHAQAGYDGHGDPEPWQLREEAVQLDGYEPIFNGLKGASPDWKWRLTTEDANRLIVDETLDDTLLYLISPTIPDKPHLKPDPLAASAYCAAALAEGTDDTGAFRRAAICVARFPELGAAHGEALAAALAPAIDMPNLFAAHDALLLYRALRHCGCGSPATLSALIAIVARSAPLFETGLAECPGLNCGVRSEPLARYRIITRGLILAAIEHPDMIGDPALQPLLAFAARREVTTPIRLRLTEVAKPMRTTCARFETDYARCRADLPYNPYVEPAAIKMTSTFILDARPPAKRCAALIRSQRKIAPELAWHPGLDRAVQRLVATHCQR